MSEPTNGELKGFCYLGYIDFNEVSQYGGTWAQKKPAPQPKALIPISYYGNQDYSQSNNLSQVMQANGGILPNAIQDIGAPQCTFLYGAIPPGDDEEDLSNPCPLWPLIKGPTSKYNIKNWDSVMAFGDIINSSNATSNTTEETVSDKQNTPIIPLREFPTGTPYSIVGKAPTRRTTYNIWKPVTATGYQPKYKKYYGDVKASINQVPENDTVYVNVNAIGKKVEIQRYYPIAKDMMYENCYLYYPSPDMPPKKIEMTGGINCGFHLHFKHTEVNVSGNNDSTSGLVVTFGSTSTDGKNITKWRIYLSPNNQPNLQYLNPLDSTNTEWKDYVNLTGPQLDQESYDIYVHFVGPIMLIGFNNETSDWNVITAVQSKYDSNKFYPQLNTDAKISIIVTNLAVKFQYSPIAFNNYNIDQVKKYGADHSWNFYKTSFAVTDTKTTNSILQKYAYLNENYDKHETGNVNNTKSDYKIAPTYFLDWRCMSGSVLSPTARRDQLVFKEVTRNNKQGTEQKEHFVCWNTTVEGPLFIGISDIPNEDAINNSKIQKSLGKIGNVSEYLTSWEVTYEPDGSLANKSFLKGTASIVLENLAITPEGKKILQLLEENVLLVTLDASYDNAPQRTFFQGLVKTVETKRNKYGSKTTLICDDIAYRVLTETLATEAYIFAGCRMRDIIQTCVQQAGFGDRYKFIENPYGDASDALWQRATTARIGKGLYLSSGSPIEGALSMSVSDPPLYQRIISKVLPCISEIHVFPIMFWHPEDQKLYLTARQQTFDTLYFLGTPDSSNIVQIPSNRHGILVDDWTISTNNNPLVSGYLFRSRNTIQNVIEEHAEFVSSMKYPSEENTFQPQHGWVGFKKLYYEDIAKLFKQTKSDVQAYAYHYYTNYLKFPYSRVEFDVYVTEPLNHWAQFKIGSFANTQDVTDGYFYGKVVYSFNKEKNIITASVVGENIPRTLA